jgi:hypothetical protein
MTPKEKAIYLFQKFDSILVALFVCDEIINEIDPSPIDNRISYWQEVKQEIELL